MRFMFESDLLLWNTTGACQPSCQSTMLNLVLPSAAGVYGLALDSPICRYTRLCSLQQHKQPALPPTMLPAVMIRRAKKLGSRKGGGRRCGSRSRRLRSSDKPQRCGDIFLPAGVMKLTKKPETGKDSGKPGANDPSGVHQKLLIKLFGKKKKKGAHLRIRRIWFRRPCLCMSPLVPEI